MGAAVLVSRTAPPGRVPANTSPSRWVGPNSLRIQHGRGHGLDKNVAIREVTGIQCQSRGMSIGWAINHSIHPFEIAF